MTCPLGKVSNTRGFFYFMGIDVRFFMLCSIENRIFYCLKKVFKKKEGIHMRITPTQSMARAERMASFLFVMAQIAVVLGLFWAFRAHLV